MLQRLSRLKQGRFYQKLKEAKDAHIKACLEVKELQKQLASADKTCLDALTIIEDNETYENVEKGFIDAVGGYCKN